MTLSYQIGDVVRYQPNYAYFVDRFGWLPRDGDLCVVHRCEGTIYEYVAYRGGDRVGSFRALGFGRVLENPWWDGGFTSNSRFVVNTN